MKVKLTTGEEITTKSNEDIYRALKREGIYLTASCGGRGICGKCKIKIVDGNYKATSSGALTKQERDEGVVLACKTYPKSDVMVEIPRLSILTVGDKIAISKMQDLKEYLSTYGVEIKPMVRRVALEISPPSLDDKRGDLDRLTERLKELNLLPMRFSHGFVSSMADVMRLSNWSFDINYISTPDNIREAIYLTSKEFCDREFGVAVDIGTTTVVVYLVNLSNGKIVDTGSIYNSQIKHGDDVITRIIYSTEGDGLEELRSAVIEDVNNLITVIRERHKIKRCEINSVVISGNTTMSHIFWGLNPESIRLEPYIPTVNKFPVWRANNARLATNSQAPVYTMPCVASYVGGDIVSGVIASKIHKSEDVCLFMDIGTNGEIVIGNKDWLVTAACSAGPCFEGGGLTSGMRAVKGAIESVSFDKDTLEPTLNVIGDSEPLGICGSGIIDALSGMFLNGIIDQKGKFIKDKTSRIRNGENGLEYVLHYDKKGGKDLVITEPDIDNIIRSKAAIYAGITTLLNEVGLNIDAIKKVYIAGGFGNYLNIQKAITIGMLPDIEASRYEFIGNTSITGACLALLSFDLLKEAEEISSRMTYIELSTIRNFMDEYVSALFLPHTDIKRFKTVQGAMLHDAKC
ncbi:MAG: ASKHA domain-containing protein [Thermodesulfovibrionales bacterium]|nr:ASKHA domain-containing protein [Thermodesulfovibrionales bacterium]